MMKSKPWLDRKWRIENFYKVIDKKSNEVSFKPNSIQQIIHKSDSKRKLILKARQLGVSTYFGIDCLDYTIFNPNVTVGLLAHKKDDVGKIFRIPKRAYDFLPESMKPEIDRGGGSKFEMYFPEIRSRIYCGLEIRGDTLQKLHISEYAFMKNPDRVLATLQTLPLDCEVTIESTPNALNHFYDLWSEASTIYEKFFFPWYMFGEYVLDIGRIKNKTKDELKLIQKAKDKYDIDITDAQIGFRRFKQEECKQGVNVKFEQEYPEDDESCFLQSGTKIFDLSKVKAHIDQSKKIDPKLHKIHYDDLQYEQLSVWKPFKKGQTYAIGCDVSEGLPSKTSDWSVMDILDCSTLEQVAQLRVKVKPHVFATLIQMSAMMYYKTGCFYPVVGVERNNHGHAVLLELENHLIYPNLYLGPDERPGFLNTKNSRITLLDDLIKAYDNNTIKINSLETLSEMQYLIDNKGKIEAQTGKHDDTIISLAIALKMANTSKGLEVYNNIGSKFR